MENASASCNLSIEVRKARGGERRGRPGGMELVTLSCIIIVIIIGSFGHVYSYGQSAPITLCSLLVYPDYIFPSKETSLIFSGVQPKLDR